MNEDVFSPPAGGLDLCIEQFTANISEGDCPNLRVPLLRGINHAAHRAIIFRPRCKLWSCPVCSRANAWVWAFRANAGAHALYDAGETMDFVCLTSHERLSPEGSWWVAPKAWSKLQNRVRRIVANWQYYSVPEVQPGTARVHFHLITNAQMEKQWWKDNARECGFGYMSDAKEVYDLGGVVGYAAKYLTKTLGDTVPPRTRRVRTSRGWPRAPAREPPEDWKFELIPRGKQMSEVAASLENAGYSVVFAGSKSAWGYVDFDN